MNTTFTPFLPAYIDDAARLLADAYAAERRASPSLPAMERLGGGRGRRLFEDELGKIAGNAGVAAFENSRLCGFMIESMRFTWKGQQVAGCEELAHAALGANRARLYSLLYQEIAGRWVEEGRHLHIIRHLAHDAALKECLYRLGFGAILAEEVRNLAAIAAPAEVAIVEDPAPAALVELQREHGRYYPMSPIFLRRDDNDADILAELQAHAAAGDKLLACPDGDGFGALFIVGASKLDGEGFLLRHTNSAQLKSAYVRPGGREQGTGTALLARAITWAKAQGFDRLFVEHETANIAGSAFWGKYFEPFVLVSMRYVDNTLPS